MSNEIAEFYVLKWVDIWNYESPCIERIWFMYPDFQELILNLDKRGLLIASIELFDKNTTNYTPPDFWSEETSFIKNREQVNLFLNSILAPDRFYFVLSLKWDDEILEAVTKSISIKIWK